MPSIEWPSTDRMLSLITVSVLKAYIGFWKFVFLAKSHIDATLAIVEIAINQNQN